MVAREPASAGRGTCCRWSCCRRCCAAAWTSAREAGCHVAGGHSIDDPEPKYGMAVTGLADPDRLLRNDAARAGLPLTLTKPLGLGVLNNRHKATGEVFPQAVAAMTALNRDAARRPRWPPGVDRATDVTGFGLLGHALQAGPGQRASRS